MVEEKIEDSILQIEDSLQEIKILLKMADTNLYSFKAYKEEKVEKPPYLSEWSEESLICEFKRITDAINNLDYVKNELEKVISKAN